MAAAEEKAKLKELLGQHSRRVEEILPRAIIILNELKKKIKNINQIKHTARLHDSQNLSEVLTYLADTTMAQYSPGGDDYAKTVGEGVARDIINGENVSSWYASLYGEVPRSSPWDIGFISTRLLNGASGAEVAARELHEAVQASIPFAERARSGRGEENVWQNLERWVRNYQETTGRRAEAGRSRTARTAAAAEFAAREAEAAAAEARKIARHSSRALEETVTEGAARRASTIDPGEVGYGPGFADAVRGRAAERGRDLLREIEDVPDLRVQRVPVFVIAAQIKTIHDMIGQAIKTKSSAMWKSGQESIANLHEAFRLLGKSHTQMQNGKADLAYRSLEDANNYLTTVSWNNANPAGDWVDDLLRQVRNTLKALRDNAIDPHAEISKWVKFIEYDDGPAHKIPHREPEARMGIETNPRKNPFLPHQFWRLVIDKNYTGATKIRTYGGKGVLVEIASRGGKPVSMLFPRSFYKQEECAEFAEARRISWVEVV